MCFVSLLLLALQVAQPTTPGAPQPTTPPTTQPAPTYDEGPLRVELLAMREIRFSATEPELAARLRSELGMQFRVRGTGITNIVRQGNIIFTALVDDTGQSLLDPDTYSEADRTITRPVTIPPDRLKADGLIITTRNKASTRGSRVLTQARAGLHLILAEQTDKLTIANPLQYMGKTIADQRLLALGIDVQLLPADELENPPPANRALLLYYGTKAAQVQKASFYDGAMRPIPARETPVTTKSGLAAVEYYFDAAPLTDETQLVLEVHPQVEDVQLPIMLDNLNLP
jgi:hypothetical protein